VSEADSSLESGISVHDLSPIEWLSWDVDLTNISPGTELYVGGVVLSTGGWSNSWDNHRVNWKAQHGIWEHGNQLLSKADPSEEDLAAAIIQFHRSIAWLVNSLPLSQNSAFGTARSSFTRFNTRTTSSPLKLCPASIATASLV
jgi:hypothetical protein